MAHDGPFRSQQDSLFYSLAEDLKTPLLRIAFQAEQAQSEAIRAIAVDTLKLLDAYILSAHAQTQFLLEPLHPAAILVDVTQELSHRARRSACTMSVHSASPQATALLHRKALVAALSSIGSVFIDSFANAGTPTKEIGIEFATYKTKKGIAVGVFHAEKDDLVSAQLLRKARLMSSTSARPFSGLLSGAAVHIFIAEQLLKGMGAELRTARRGSRRGLAADFLPSSQLLLV